MNEIDLTPEVFEARYAPKKITAYLIDVYGEIASVVEIPKTLDAYRRALDCERIDIIDRQIGVRCPLNRNPRRYDIICDDEALFHDPQKISAIDGLGKPMLCGNLLIVKFDGAEDNVSLDEDDIAYLNRFIEKQATHNFPTPYFMLHQCEY